MAKSGLKIVKDSVPKLFKALSSFPRMDVLVGVPEENAERKSPDDKHPINNAALAYIHNYGAPEAGIPQREFMRPGILAVKPQIIKYFKLAGDAGLKGDTAKVERYMTAVGLICQNSIRATIQAGLDPALAESTLKARARLANRKKGIAISKGARKQLTTGEISTTPLIVTGGLLKSLTYVLRKNKKIKQLSKNGVYVKKG